MQAGGWRANAVANHFCSTTRQLTENDECDFENRVLNQEHAASRFGLIASFTLLREQFNVERALIALHSITMTTVDFEAHLKRQIGFLNQSCAAFDAGQIDEAIRIATIVRVIVHQTKRSTSLLKHLNATTINLLSTAQGANPETLFSMNMGTISISGDGTSSYYPSLGEGAYKELIPVSKWWEQVIMVSHPVRLSRRKIVLSAANQDGGAHVDAVLDSDYKDMKDKGFMNIAASKSDGSSSSGNLENTHLVCLRQMGYELLNSPQLIKLAGG